jgi:hypothetical protein
MNDIDTLVDNLFDEPLKTPVEPSNTSSPRMTNHEAYERFYSQSEPSTSNSSNYPQPLHHAIAAYPDGTVFGLVLILPASLLKPPSGGGHMVLHRLLYDQYLDPDLTDAIVDFLNIPREYFSNISIAIQKDLFLNSILLSLTCENFVPYLPARWPGQALETRVITKSELNNILSLMEMEH